MEDYTKFLNPLISPEVAREIEKLYAIDNGSESMEAYLENGRKYHLRTKSRGTLHLKVDPINRIFVIQTVSFNHQNQGYGTKLVQLIEKWAKDSGCKACMLESINTEAGYGLAVKLGYKYYDERAEYVPEIAKKIGEIIGFVAGYSHIKWF